MVGRTTTGSTVDDLVARRLQSLGIMRSTRRLLAVTAAALWVLTMFMSVAVSLLRDAGLSLRYAATIRGVYFAVVIAAVLFAFERLFGRFARETDAELRRLYGQELETAERLRELTEARNEIITQVAHELRTPVTVLVGNARVLVRRHGEMSEERLDAMLDAMARASDRVMGLPELLAEIMRPEDPEGLRALARRSS